MFKENRFIKQFEILPPSQKKLKFGPPSNPEKGREIVRDLKEKEKEEQEDTERVAEKLIDELEMPGIKCPRCGFKNARQNDQIKNKLPGRIYLKCTDCNYEWEEQK